MFLGDYYAKKWLDFQSRGAGEINEAFLGWLSRRRPDRPFLAFLNYFDAHEPYVPPIGTEARFGIEPTTAVEFQFLHDYVGLTKSFLKRRYLDLALDCYDDCIAYLDEELGRLLDRLQAQGLLDHTDVIITSDHGEGFGDHGIFGHGYNVYLDEVGVPLVILSPTAPAGRVVNEAVTLRDLPATVVDLLGLSADSPLPGRSLSACWNLPPGQSHAELTSPVFSERLEAAAFPEHLQDSREHTTFEMSLVAAGHHYIRDGMGNERLYDLATDRFERLDLMNSTVGKERVQRFRGMLLSFLNENQGSAEVERAYLELYRKQLQEDVEEPSPPQVAVHP